MHFIGIKIILLKTLLLVSADLFAKDVLVIGSKFNYPWYFENSLNASQVFENEFNIVPEYLFHIPVKRLKKQAEDHEQLARFRTLTHKNFKEIITESLSRSTQNEKLIYFNGHGGFSKQENIIYDSKKILDSFYFPMIKNKFVGPKITDIREAIRGAINTPTAIVSSQCYSGSFHFLSSQIKNLCSVSNAPWWRRATVDTDGSRYIKNLFSLYDVDFDFNGDKTHTLFESHIKAMSHEAANFGFPQISSWSQLDYLLCGQGFRLINGRPRCLDEQYLDSEGVFFKIRNDEALKQVTTTTYEFNLLDQDQIDFLHPKLKNFYLKFINSDFFLGNRSWQSVSRTQFQPRNNSDENARFYTIYQILVNLKKYTLAKKVKNSQELESIDQLIDCEFSARIF
jgi:hypothetical protein